ncbi:hypothetical protein [Methylocaldum gracile]
MSLRKIIILAVVLILLMAGGIWLRKQLQIDSCLDAGGRWNYEEGVCETR